MVVPRYQRPTTIGQSIDFTTIFIVESTDTQSPIGQADRSSQKAEQADTQMRDPVREPISRLRIPKLHGVSALGVRLAFYQYDAATQILQPPAISRDPIHINDTAPAARWSVDLLSEEGYEQLVQLATETKDMARALGV